MNYILENVIKFISTYVTWRLLWHFLPCKLHFTLTRTSPAPFIMLFPPLVHYDALHEHVHMIEQVTSNPITYWSTKLGWFWGWLDIKCALFVWYLTTLFRRRTTVFRMSFHTFPQIGKLLNFLLMDWFSGKNSKKNDRWTVNRVTRIHTYVRYIWRHY